MAKRNKKRKSKNSNVKKVKKTKVTQPSSTERDIEKFKLYAVIVQTLGTLLINFKDQILKWFS